MNRFVLFALIAFIPTIIIAQKEGKDAIKEMCGCYEVEFNFAETFPGSYNYGRKDVYTSGALEWIVADEETENDLVLQHILIVGEDRIVKHWRQDWSYEDTEQLEFVRDLEWKHKSLKASEVAGTWTQKVYEVGGSPRYQGHATWIFADDRKYWESKVDAPLPRREYTIREDYNVMSRVNHHEIVENGHFHEQDNAKVLRSENGDSLIVLEKGMNLYTKVADKKCKLAETWWKEHRIFWVDVRSVWEELLAENEYVNIRWEVDGDRLWERIFALQNELLGEGTYDQASGQEAIAKVIKEYLFSEPTPWASK